MSSAPAAVIFGTGTYLEGGVQVPLVQGNYVAAFDENGVLIGSQIVPNSTNGAFSLTVAQDDPEAGATQVDDGLSATEDWNVWFAVLNNGTGMWQYYRADNGGAFTNYSGMTEVYGNPMARMPMANTTGDNTTELEMLLPVRFGEFTATATPGRVRLNWTTELELNADYFAVERSQDGRKFDLIGEIKAAGYSEQTQHYAFEDQHPGSGTIYYRLREVDYDGTEQFSSTLVVEITPTERLVTAFPNPTTGWVRLSGYDFTTEVNFRLLSTDGRLIRTGTLTDAALDLSDLDSGGYLLQLTDAKHTATLRLHRL